MKTIFKASKITKACRPVLALAFLLGWGSVGCEYYSERPQEKTSNQESTKTQESERTIVSGDSETIKNLEAKINELQGQLANKDDTETRTLQAQIAELQRTVAGLKDDSRTVQTPASQTPPTAEKESTEPTSKETTPEAKPIRHKTSTTDYGSYVAWFDQKSAAGATTEETDPPSPKDPAGKKVIGLTLHFQTGPLENMGRDGTGKVMFDLCKTENFDDLATCFRARFNDQDPSHLTLDKGRHESIEFHKYPRLTDNSRRGLESLVYPDDLKFFRLASDPDNKIDDGWFVQGVELLVQLKGEEKPKMIYRNPCAGRWVENEQSGGSAHPNPGNLGSYSPHSIENDDAFCVYMETGDADNAGADNVTISALVPMDAGQSFDDTTNSWIADYNPGEAPQIKVEGNHFRVPLHHDHWDDYGVSDGASYAFTVYNGMHRMDEGKIRLSTDGRDGMLLHRVRAYHFKPGDPEFLEKNKCLYEQFTPNQWLENEPNEETEPNWPIEGFAVLSETTCPELGDIEIGSCDFAYGVFTDDWHDLKCAY